jgi:hypothetical protein
MALSEFDVRRLDDAAFKRRRKEQARRFTTMTRESAMSDPHDTEHVKDDMQEDHHDETENMDESMQEELEEAKEADEAEAEPDEEADEAQAADKD